MLNKKKPQLLRVSGLARRINAALHQQGTKPEDSAYMEHAKRVAYGR